MNLQAYLIAAALLLSAGFAGGWTVNGWRYDAAQMVAEKKAEQDREARTKKAAEVVNATQKQKAVIRWRTKIIYREIATRGGDLLCTDSDRVRAGELWNKVARETGGTDAAVRGAGRGAGEADNEGLPHGPR